MKEPRAGASCNSKGQVQLNGVQQGGSNRDEAGELGAISQVRGMNCILSAVGSSSRLLKGGVA